MTPGSSLDSWTATLLLHELGAGVRLAAKRLTQLYGPERNLSEALYPRSRSTCSPAAWCRLQGLSTQSVRAPASCWCGSRPG